VRNQNLKDHIETEKEKLKAELLAATQHLQEKEV
jgi:hypothetical protein